MIPQRLDQEADAEAICDVAERWQLHPQLALLLHRLASLSPVPLSIISGYRTAEEQAELDVSTKAPDHLSTHRSCPATGADIASDELLSIADKLELGRIGERLGLRWGGGARRDANGLPVGNEWAHFDLGRRSG